SELDDSYYGTALRAVCVPVFDDDDPNRVAGSVGLATPRDNEMVLMKIADNFVHSLEEISLAIQQTAIAAGDINTSERNLSEKITSIQQLAAEIISVLDFIKQVADETKMLGLNAAIEAARAGEAGRGFGVVAEEIRKLSQVSRTTADKIRTMTKSIEESINEAAEGSRAAIHATEEQAATTEEITASVQEMTSLATELDRIAHMV
ncbi:MAG: methyl-accepting chemotaxis protein, partial [Chitinophagales bacterium]